MSSVIDTTYFEKGYTYIPRVTDLTPASDDTLLSQTDLENMIVTYEREILLNSLGVTLYNELVNILTNNQLEHANNVKFKRLVDGYSYTNSAGVEKIWDGLKGFNKQSVIAFYVFCKYLRNDIDLYSINGIVRSTSKNAENINPTAKFMSVYSMFLKAYQGNMSKVHYPNLEGHRFGVVVNAFGTVGIDWYSDDTQVSLYQFLNDYNDLEEDNFSTFQFKFYPYLNSFGI